MAPLPPLDLIAGHQESERPSRVDREHTMMAVEIVHLLLGRLPSAHSLLQVEAVPPVDVDIEAEQLVTFDLGHPPGQTLAVRRLNRFIKCVADKESASLPNGF